MQPQASASTTSNDTRTASGERFFRRLLTGMTVIVVMALAALFVYMFWAQHAVTQVEAIAAIHSRTLAEGGGLYYNLNQYPYTVAPYGPLFYGSVAALYKLGLPLLTAGRLLAFTSLLGILFLTARLLRLYQTGRYSVWVGTLLVAATANFSNWGTLNQSDMPALFFSVAAFYLYSQHRFEGGRLKLAGTGLMIALAIFTKQTFIAAPAAIVLLLFLENRRLALRFVLTLGLVGVSIALGLNWSTGGRYFDNAIFANLNPFSLENLLQHTQYLLLAGGGLLILAAAGLRPALRDGGKPLYVYLATSLLVLAATGPKVGSDLNYQLETMVVLAWCSAWALRRLDFFPLLFRADRSWVTLLQIPIFLHLAVNLLGAGNLLLVRVGREQLRYPETAAYRSIFDVGQRKVISVQIDPLLQMGRPIDVEPLIYTLLVEAGLTDPEPVRRDLADRKIAVVVLYEDLFSKETTLGDLEVPTLPAPLLEEVRKHYRLSQHVPGPLLNGTYVYLPVDEPRP